MPSKNTYGMYVNEILGEAPVNVGAPNKDGFMNKTSKILVKFLNIKLMFYRNGTHS